MIILGLALIGYCVYAKRCEMKKIQAISGMYWLNYEEISKLIDKIRE